MQHKEHPISTIVQKGTPQEISVPGFEKSRAWKGRRKSPRRNLVDVIECHDSGERSGGMLRRYAHDPKPP
jgi:hypothetical protein